jgi:tetratricopeptide (TPR) repeat protein
MAVLPQPADQEALMQQIRMHFKEGHLKQAHKALDLALAAEPGSVPLLMLRALAQSRQSLWEPAQADFAAARAAAPDDPEAWLGEALCLAARNMVYPAMELFEGMASRFPDFVRGHIQAARFYYKLVVLPKGKAHLDAALAADPSSDERREIEAVLVEQSRLDKKRYHRPDFEGMRRAKAARAQS